MLWFLLTAASAIVFVALILVGISLKRSASKTSTDSYGSTPLLSGGKIMLASLLVPVLWLAASGFISFKQIPAGHVGVIYQFGAIVGHVPNGGQFVMPWQDVEIASIQVQRHAFDQLNSFSAETQDVFIKATINYQVEPEAIESLYREVGPTYFERLVEARVNQNFKDETVKYVSVQIAPHREEIRQAVLLRLKRELAPYSINVIDLLIDNIDFSPAFKQSIENKQIATQDALRAQEVVNQKRYEANQAIETAKGEAERKREEARGNADALRTNADAQAYANNVLAKSLTPELIQFQAMQKLADNIQIALIPSGQGLIIDPATLLQKLEKEK